MSSDSTVLPLFTFFSPEIEEFLLNNAIDLQSELEKSGHKVESQLFSDPAASGSKDAVTVLLASAAASVTLVPAITRLLEGLLHRPIKTTELLPVALTDSSGRPVKDAKGQQKIVWLERTKITLPRPNREETKMATSIMGFKFEYSSKPSK